MKTQSTYWVSFGSKRENWCLGKGTAAKERSRKLRWAERDINMWEYEWMNRNERNKDNRERKVWGQKVGIGGRIGEQ